MLRWAFLFGLVFVGGLVYAYAQSPQANNETSAKQWCYAPTNGLEDWQPCSPTNPLAVTTSSALPSGSTAIIGVGTDTTGAVVGTLAAAAGKTTYICGLDVSAIGGTATIGPIVVAGLKGGSFTYQLAATASGNTLSRTFTPCLPGSAANTAITVTTTADGTASAVDVNSFGYQQ